MNTLKDWYDNLWLTRDKRLDGWFMMDSILPTVIISTLYILFVTIIGPRVMKHREPFKLKAPIQIYNITSVVLSAYMFYEFGVSGWFGRYNYLCQDVETDTDGLGMRMARVVWIYYLSKFFEFLDTLFFILRKKFGHVSLLHVIHHGIMPVYSYLMIRWLPGGHETLSGLINSLIHVIMYSYYFLAALGPHMQPYLWWKKYLTTFQMIQFLVIFTRSNIVIWGLVPGCSYPWQFSLMSAALMVVFFVLFAQFYMQEYNSKKKKKA